MKAFSQNRIDLNSPFLIVVKVELNEFFLSLRALHFLPLMLLGVYLMSWTYKVAPPYIAVVLVVFCSLEPQCNNIFYHSPGELEILNLFPIDWKQIILAKNIATMILIGFCLMIASAALFFFSPEVVGIQAIISMIFYCSTVIFPIIQIGNSSSIKNPRRKCGWQFADFLEMLWLAITLMIVSIPYALIVSYFDYAFIYVLYAGANGYYWYRYSIPNCAKLLNEQIITICSRS
jgi:hypothetical protein